jgi:hypothetical protein
MFQFTLKESGGKSGHILKNTMAFVRKTCPGTTLGKEIYEVLGGDCKGHSSGQSRNSAKHALLKAAYLLPNIMKPAHCRAVLSDGAAESMITTFKQMVNQVPGVSATDTSVKHAISHAEVAIVLHYAKVKATDDAKLFETAAGAMHNIITKFRDSTKVNVKYGEFANTKEQQKQSNSSQQATVATNHGFMFGYIV